MMACSSAHKAIAAAEHVPGCLLRLSIVWLVEIEMVQLE
jgi:hypothetical protein